METMGFPKGVMQRISGILLGCLAGVDVSSLKKHKKHLLALAITLLFLVSAGCAVSNSEAGVSGGGPDDPAQQQLRYFGEFKDQYPDEYASFMQGALLIEEDGIAHSHANLRNRVEQDPKILEVGAACLSCKTYEFNELYTEYGAEIFYLPYAEITGKVADMFSCRTCHANGDPLSGADATLVTYTTYAAEFLKTVDPQTAACGQCHNTTCDYVRYIVQREGVTLADLDPYRYGTSADALRQAGLEDNTTLYPDKELGVAIPYRAHADIELFQGSHHQELGLTCVSCHMPYETNAAGVQYRSHNASGSPLESEAAMKSCLTCHEAQGISSTIEMRAFVRERQAAIGTLEEEVTEGLALLRTLIIAAETEGTLDQVTLRKAKDCYVDATYYYTFQHAGADIPGGKVAHAPDRMYAYLEQSKSQVEEGLSLFS